MSLDVTKLPLLGVGASLSLEAMPDPAQLVRARGGPRFIEYAGRAPVGHVAAKVDEIRTHAPVLFHPSYMHFCGTRPNETAWMKETADHVAAVGSPWFAQDCAMCFSHEQTYSTSLGYFVPPILSEASLAVAEQRVREVQAQVPVPIALEPPPTTFVVGRMHPMAFFGGLAERTDAALLLDAGHLVSWAMVTGLSTEALLEPLPFDRVVEVHVAGGRIDGGGAEVVYVDAHDRAILDETWAMFDAVLARAKNLRAVCFECEGTSADEVLRVLARVRAHVVEHSCSEELRTRAREELA